MVHWNKGPFFCSQFQVLITRLANPYKSSPLLTIATISPQKRCDFTFQLPVFRSCQSRILSTLPPPKREMRRPSHHLQPLRGSMYCWQHVAGMVTNALLLFIHNLLISWRANPVIRYLTVCHTYLTTSSILVTFMAAIPTFLQNWELSRYTYFGCLYIISLFVLNR